MSKDNPLWKYAVISAYTDEGVDDTWLQCPQCGERPRTWVFDNGRYAKCCCADMYGPAQATAEDIMSVYNRCNGDVSSYCCDDLRLAWNKYIKEMR